MADIKEIISQNILTIRKKRKLTQIELSEKLNYSDKAISRWEKGESLPDLETLYSLSEILEVPVSSFFEENAFAEVEARPLKQANKILVVALSCMVVWLCATIVYVYLNLYANIKFWQAFIWAVPTMCVVLKYYNKVWGKKVYSISITSLLIWSLIASIYFQLIDYNIWIIFLLGPVIQAILIIAHFIKPIKSNKKGKNN